MEMNATSRPSRRTPLNDTANETPPIPVAGTDVSS
jgi:hypothetical protein